MDIHSVKVIKGNDFNDLNDNMTDGKKGHYDKIEKIGLMLLESA